MRKISITVTIRQCTMNWECSFTQALNEQLSHSEKVSVHFYQHHFLRYGKRDQNTWNSHQETETSPKMGDLKLIFNHNPQQDYIS